MENENFSQTQKFIYGAGCFLFGVIILAVFAAVGIKNPILTFLLLVIPFFIGYFYPRLGRNISKLVISWGVVGSRGKATKIGIETAQGIGEGKYDNKI